MSQENLAPTEVLSRWTEAFNTGDYETTLALTADDVEYHELRGMPGARGMVGVYNGKEEVTRWFIEFLSGWESGFRNDPVETMELDDGRVLRLETWRGRGLKSAVEVEMSAVGLYTVRDGKVACCRYFKTKAEALESVGLLE